MARKFLRMMKEAAPGTDTGITVLNGTATPELDAQSDHVIDASLRFHFRTHITAAPTSAVPASAEVTVGGPQTLDT